MRGRGVADLDDPSASGQNLPQQAERSRGQVFHDPGMATSSYERWPTTSLRARALPSSSRMVSSPRSKSIWRSAIARKTSKWPSAIRWSSGLAGPRRGGEPGRCVVHPQSRGRLEEQDSVDFLPLTQDRRGPRHVVGVEAIPRIPARMVADRLRPFVLSLAGERDVAQVRVHNVHAVGQQHVLVPLEQGERDAVAAGAAGFDHRLGAPELVGHAGQLPQVEAVHAIGGQIVGEDLEREVVVARGVHPAQQGHDARAVAGVGRVLLVEVAREREAVLGGPVVNLLGEVPAGRRRFTVAK